MFSLKFNSLLHLSFLLLCLRQATCQYVPDDNVVRGGEFDSKPTSPADKEGSGNSVVVLGVTLCLSVIFAIAGIFIGVYFHVERFLCCCCNQRDTASKLEVGDAPLYGSDKTKTTNMFMTAASNTAFTHDEEKLPNSSVAVEDKNDVKEKDSAIQFAPRRKPFFPPNTKKKKAKETSLMVDDPIAFGSSTTHVTDDGSIVRSTDKNSLQPPPRKARRHHNNETTYKSFSTQQDDILF